ncbi:hypothetical protein [Haladaptatus sp. NG-SE-30]
MLGHFISGLMAVYLWIHGLGLLAVAVNAGHNLGIELVLMGKNVWKRRSPNVFSPGEVHQVTVRSEPPNKSDLQKAETADGRTLEVADVTPGEVCRVRIAGKRGWSGYAYPLAMTDDTDEHAGR